MTNKYGETVRLFHSQVFMPESIAEEALAVQTRLGKAEVRLSLHVGEHCDEEDRRRSGEPSVADRSHAFVRSELAEAISRMAEKPMKPFEVEATLIHGRWQVTKYAVRLGLRKGTDITVVIRPKYGDTVAFVATAWLNDSDDLHSTLDRSKYDVSL